MPDARHREGEVLGRQVEYEVRRSTDASEPRIDVDIDGVTVVLPEADETEPSDLLEENAAWVVEKVEKYDAYREQVPERRFVEGETFPYLGEQREVVIEQRPSSVVGETELRLANHHVEQTSVKRALEALYRRTARDRFERRADHFTTEMDVEYEQIEIRNQRTKWGSCSTSGTLGLNWRLMMAPPEISDYVVVHELAHLREANHDDAFWSLVGQHDSEYQSHAAWLERHSTQLIFDDDDL